MTNLYSNEENLPKTESKENTDERISDFLFLFEDLELKVKDSVVKRVVDFACSYDCLCGNGSNYELFKN